MRTSVTDTDELSELAPAMPVTSADDRTGALDRRAVRDARRRARRSRRLFALGGLAILGAFLATTVVVVDMVR
ncbi:MAG TPA: hypothetical protein VKR78_06570 [Acidimicrobiales bacterium]|jgi:hypothetical protein|nr:hypothetical protein [Acidimicrobiales bacterium]